MSLPPNGGASIGLCARCGCRSDPKFTFCPHCGTALAAQQVVPVLERRRVVVLFCDLVGFSELASESDPEDVQSLLARYHRAVRGRIESFGGIVEKFAGDAVMAVFGAPEAHEDDPERAVGAALDALAALDLLNRRTDGVPLHARIGVHLGETVVAVTADPTQGEAFVTGDVVNMAARLQSVAPVDAVAVSRAVVQATNRRFTFSPLTPVKVKGRATPLEHWRVEGATVVTAVVALPALVGRRHELEALTSALDLVVEQRGSQVVALVAGPGLGKSRLLAEFRATTRARRGGVAWLQGRCLPYGDGVTFWALGEILKGFVGILDSDDSEVARAKLEQVLPGEGEPAWLRARLLPLLGVDSRPVDREELFAAWSRTLALCSQDGPAVVVLEDLHWADPALLEFTKTLAAQSLEGPLLIVFSLRPGLLDRHPQWLSESTTTIRLAPLTANETEQLIGSELDGGRLPTDTRRAFLERAEGNPLYALEFARLLHDRQLVDADGALRPGVRIPVPDGVHALVSARLDTLSMSERGVLQDAAVVGKVFWSGAIATMSDRNRSVVERILETLEAKGVVHQRPTSSVAHEREYAFGHAVLRDVTYGRASRARRIRAHLSAMRWIESASGSRVDEVAEVLVHHATTALDLAESSGDHEAIAEARTGTRTYALAAARRALGLDAVRSLQLLDLARSLTPEGEVEEPEVLLTWSRAALAADRVRDALLVVSGCVSQLRESGSSVEVLADALMVLGDLRYKVGDSQGALAADGEAADLSRTLPAAADHTDAVANLALTLAALADPTGLDVAQEAERRASDAGEPIPLPALRARGMLRLQMGDPGGLVDHDEAVRRLHSVDSAPGSLANAMNGRVEAVWAVEGPTAAVQACAEAIEFADSRGLAIVSHWTEVNRLLPLLEAGQVRRAFDEAARLWPILEAAGSLAASEALAALVEAAFELGEGEAFAAWGDRIRHYTQAALDGAEDPEDVALNALPAAQLELWDGNRQAASGLLGRIVDAPGISDTPSYGHRLTAFVRAALACDDVATAESLATLHREDRTLRRVAQDTASALLLQAKGEHRGATEVFDTVASRWRAVGNRFEHAHARLGLGLSLTALGDPKGLQVSAEAAQLRRDMAARVPVLASTDE